MCSLFFEEDNIPLLQVSLQKAFHQKYLYKYIRVLAQYHLLISEKTVFSEHKSRSPYISLFLIL